MSADSIFLKAIQDALSKGNENPNYDGEKFHRDLLEFIRGEKPLRETGQLIESQQGT